MAKNIKILNENRKLLRKMSKLAAVDARLRFTPELTAAGYAKVFREVMNQSTHNITVLPWKKFKADSNFKQKGDPWLPRGLKKKIKNILKISHA